VAVQGFVRWETSPFLPDGHHRVYRAAKLKLKSDLQSPALKASLSSFPEVWDEFSVSILISFVHL
jgi:hypothetical protein